MGSTKNLPFPKAPSRLRHLTSRKGSQLALASLDLTPAEIRARFQWASSQGHPQWLWPEVGLQPWAQALDRIAAVARDVMLYGKSRDPLHGDATAFAVAGFTSGMGPLLGYWHKGGKIAASGPVAAMFELHLRHNRLRMADMAERASFVSRALSDAKIPHTFLKGMHTAYSYFPEPGTRPMSDIDILIAPQHESPTGKVLRKLGFVPGLARSWPREQTWRKAGSPHQPRGLHLVHAEDPWSIDLHTSLNRRYASGSPILRLDDVVPQDFSSRSTYAPGARVLDQPLLSLHLAVHMCCGLESLTMLRIVELALVVSADFADDLDGWRKFLDVAQRARALGCIYPALKLCEELVPGTVPEEVRKASRRESPSRVKRVIDSFTPANAQRVVRCSLTERFMWAPSRSAVVRQVLSEVFPPGSSSLPTLMGIYRTRLFRFVRRTLTR